MKRDARELAGEAWALQKAVSICPRLAWRRRGFEERRSQPWRRPEALELHARLEDLTVWMR